MNVGVKGIAKFGLCRELYELSGWRWTNCYYRVVEGKPVTVDVVLALPRTGVHLPAYDAGFLIEKLPQKVDGARLVVAGMPMSDYWGCAYLYGLNISFDASQIADTLQVVSKHPITVARRDTLSGHDPMLYLL